MTRPLAAALPVLFALAAHAQLSIGPEQPASQPEFAPPTASAAAIATSGNGSLVAFQPAGRNMAYAQLLDEKGQPQTPHGVALPPAQTGQTRTLAGAASDGKGYVVLWNQQGMLTTVHVSLTGEVSSPQVLAGGRATTSTPVQPRIASNGDGYLAAWVDQVPGGYAPIGVHLDSSGAEVGVETPLTTVRNAITDVELASNGSSYLAAVGGFVPNNGAPDVSLVPVDGAGHPGTAVKSAITMVFVSLAATGPGYLLAWAEVPYLKAAPADAQGHLGRQVVIGQTQIGIESMRGGKDGALLIVRDSAGAPLALRLDAQGNRTDTWLVPQDAIQYVAGVDASGSYFAVALAPAPLLISPVLPPQQSGTATPLVTFPAPQQQPHVAVMGDLRVVAWRESGALRATRVRGGLPLDPAALTISDNAIASAAASDGARTLLAWQTRPAGSPPVIAGRFLTPDGALSAPFKISDVPFDQFGSNAQLDAAAPAGNGFVVVWRVRTLPANGREEWRLWRAVVDVHGSVVVPPAPLDLPVSATNVGLQQLDPAVAPTSDGFLVVYDEMVPYPVGTQLRHDVWAAPFHADATPAGPRQPVAASLDAEQLPDVASDGNGHLLLVFADTPLLGGTPSIWSLPLNEDGTAVGNAAFLGGGSAAHVAWNGGTFVVVTTDGHLLAPLNRILTAPAPISGLVIAGDTIAYVRSAADAGLGDSDRVFVRRLGSGKLRASRP